MTRASRRPRGFVLLVVLWTVVGVAATAMVAAVIAREAVAAAGNRVAFEQASWQLDGCVEQARAQLELAMRRAGDRAWAALDSIALTVEPACSVRLTPAGTTLDVNRASQQALYTLLVTAGLEPTRADSLSAAIVDWRDANDSTTESGAETGWYREAHRVEPRNGPFTAAAEIRLVRGAAWLPGLDTLLDVDDAAILLSRAPVPVLMATAGLHPAAVAAIVSRRSSSGLGSLPAFVASLAEPVRSTLLASLPAILATTVTSPIAWKLRATLRTHGLEIAADVRLGRDASRLPILDRKTWP